VATNNNVRAKLPKLEVRRIVVIERTHVNELLNVAPVFNERDTTGLRRFYDKIKINHRGLKALEVDACMYEGIVVLAILGKLPEAVKLQITRGKNHTEWKMEDLLKELLSELELREEHCTISKSESSQYTRSDKDKKKKDELNTASTLPAKINDFCAYCKGGHAYQDCTIVKSVEERRQLLRRYGRCFFCARKGHIFHDGNSKLTCSICKGKHHISICYQSDSTNGDQFSRTHNHDCNGSLNSDRASNACPAHTGKPGGTTH